MQKGCGFLTFSIILLLLLFSLLNLILRFYYFGRFLYVIFDPTCILMKSSFLTSLSFPQCPHAPYAHAQVHGLTCGSLLGAEVGIEFDCKGEVDITIDLKNVFLVVLTQNRRHVGLLVTACVFHLLQIVQLLSCLSADFVLRS